ncbi:hypothetical protein CCR75_001787 [Bremia lactucae]|uniref:Uncharacterized protein n=1 Tax=Bremia lactucae TaxID=4779 RepID=A0A976FSE0_BRELC|nr:hypothetical protein CCR75_001787 [Bremia lactucae]
MTVVGVGISWDMQRARENEARLRSLLEQSNVSDDILPPPVQRLSLSDVTSSKEQQRQANFDSTSVASLELASSNDRIAQLENQLLDAEETICHLKAEKLAALRDIERLLATTSEGGRQAARQEDASGQTRNLVLELKTQLAEQKEEHRLQQERQTAIIQNQERELQNLRDQLLDTTRQYEDLQQRHMDLLEVDDEVAMPQSDPKAKMSLETESKSAVSDETDSTLRRGRAPANADTVNSKWFEELVRHPTPHFDLNSPEVAYLLRAWTIDMKKWRYLRRWLLQVVQTKGPLPDAFPMAVELPRLSPEVRDGFLTLVLPLLRKQTERDILAHCRKYNDGIHTDVRFRVVPRP